MARLAALAAAALFASACAPAANDDAVAPAAEALASAPPSIPPPPADPLAVGSEAARDDLYCSGLIFAAHPTPIDAVSPMEQARLVQNQNLGVMIGDAGVNKLVAEGAAHATHAAGIVDAYTSQALSDLDAGAPRISLEACLARAEALPPFE